MAKLSHSNPDLDDVYINEKDTPDLDNLKSNILWDYYLDDYLLINKHTEKVMAVSGNSEFDDVPPEDSYYIVKVVGFLDRTGLSLNV